MHSQTTKKTGIAFGLGGRKYRFQQNSKCSFSFGGITGEIFHSKNVNADSSLDAAMKYMSENGGMIIYLRQEGRNIGIINKLRAYALQEKGFDTVEANLNLDCLADGRNFDVAVEMLKILNVKEINLLTNNPDKLKSLENSGIKLNHRVP
jgi:GTP cyclohydrolase II